MDSEQKEIWKREKDQQIIDNKNKKVEYKRREVDLKMGGSKVRPASGRIGCQDIPDDLLRNQLNIEQMRL